MNSKKIFTDMLVGTVIAILHFVYKTEVLNSSDIGTVIIDSLTVAGVLLTGIGGLMLIRRSLGFSLSESALKQLSCSVLRLSVRNSEECNDTERNGPYRGKRILLSGLPFLTSAVVGCIIYTVVHSVKI